VFLFFVVVVVLDFSFVVWETLNVDLRLVVMEVELVVCKPSSLDLS